MEGQVVKLKWATISTLIAVAVYTVTITRYITRLEAAIERLEEKEASDISWILGEIKDHEQRIRYLERNE